MPTLSVLGKSETPVLCKLTCLEFTNWSFKFIGYSHKSYFKSQMRWSMRHSDIVSPSDMVSLSDHQMAAAIVSAGHLL